MAANANQTSVDRLREALLRRGSKTVKGMARTFRIYDDDGNKCLNFEEFNEGLNDYGLGDVLTQEERRNMFAQFDTDGNGTLNFDEFLIALKPPMSDARRRIVQEAFKKFDKTGDGVVNSKDLKRVYKVKDHPKYVKGEWDEEQCFKDFLSSFENPNDRDGTVTEDEFMNYYSKVGVNIDDDVYFDLMIRQAWKI